MPPRVACWAAHLALQPAPPSAPSGGGDGGAPCISPPRARLLSSRACRLSGRLYLSRPVAPCLPAAACIPPSTSCVAGTYQVSTPGGLGCLSCFDLNVAVGPKCGPKGTISCTASTCTCNFQYTG